MSVEPGKYTKLGAMISYPDRAVEEPTCDYGVTLMPKNPFNFHGEFPFVSTRILTNDAAAYGTFSEKDASKDGDTTLTDRGISPEGPNGDSRHIPVAGETILDA